MQHSAEMIPNTKPPSLKPYTHTHMHTQTHIQQHGIFIHISHTRVVPSSRVCAYKYVSDNTFVSRCFGCMFCVRVRVWIVVVAVVVISRVSAAFSRELMGLLTFHRFRDTPPPSSSTPTPTQ